MHTITWPHLGTRQLPYASAEAAAEASDPREAVVVGLVKSDLVRGKWIWSPSAKRLVKSTSKHSTFPAAWRAEVARETKSTKKLEELAGDEEFYVRLSVSLNKETPPEVKDKLAEEGLGGYMVDVAANSKTPARSLEILAESNFDPARIAVAKNRNTPAETLRKLAKDRILDVAYAARDNLRERGIDR